MLSLIDILDIEKCGMKYEVRLKNRMIDKNTGKYDDLLSYSISAK